MKRLLILLCACIPLLASIDGTVVNRTSGKPEAGVPITLLKPGAKGMQTLGTTASDASGHFLFVNDQPGGGPQLLQAKYHDVNYNKLLTPNIPTSGVTLDVYEVSKSPASAQIAEQMIILEPTLSQLAVTQTVVVKNNSTTTYNNPELGGLMFYLPPAANGQVRVNATSSGGMPLPRAAERTAESDVYKVDFPIKPGDTEFQVNYVLPVGTPLVYHGRVVNVKGMQTSALRLVVPPGVTLDSKDVQQIGTEPTTQATIYNVVAPDLFSVNVAGIGSLQNGNGADGEDTGQPQVVEGQPRIYNHLRLLLGLAFAILAVGLLILFRTSPIQPNVPSHRT